MDNAQTTFRSRPGATEGEWWVFDSYEIRAGCICPAQRARLKWYDPWLDFQNTRKQTIGQAPTAGQPGYQSLMKLVHQLEYLPGHKRYPDCLTQKSQDLILEWCQQYGLLGALLSRWESISLAPQHDDVNHWVQRRFFRGFGQVVQVQETAGDVKDGRGTVLIHGLNDLNLVEESPGKTWSSFFPTVEFSERDTFSYPRPYTEEFCHLYGERLIDFCKAAKLLVGAMLHLSAVQPQINGDHRLAKEQALDAINILRRPVSSVLDFEEDGTVKQRHVAPSLLASFADMFAQDLFYGRATLQCTCCGTPFISSNYQAQYCSVLCRLREQKRRLRAQMKQAKELRSQGQSLREIATAVDQPIVIVRGWLAQGRKKPG